MNKQDDLRHRHLMNRRAFVGMAAAGAASSFRACRGCAGCTKGQMSCSCMDCL